MGYRFAVLTLVMSCSTQAADFVWWEGESPTATNFPKQTWFDPQNDGERDKLSGGDWLTNIDQRAADEAEPFARYAVTVPADGEYALWVRKMWKHGPFRWRFDQQAWRTCGRDIALADSVTLRTHVPANWVLLGTVKLTRGRRTFELRLTARAGEAKTAGIDCFVLSRGPFVPNGKRRPGRRTGKAMAGYFAWEPAVDPFTDESAFDLRHLNEQVAGMHGPVRRLADGLVLGDGTPARFFAVNVSAANAAQDRGSVDYLARKLAKLGVNLVRYHSPIFNGDTGEVDSKKLDDLHYLVAALKKQGIYTELSTYFPLWLNAKAAGLNGFDRLQNSRPFALVYFEPAFQRMYSGWLKSLLTTGNPYTGTPLAHDPAVAMVELVNEDSLFFWTLTKKNVPEVNWQLLEQRFAGWLIGRHGSLDRAYAGWGGGQLDGDQTNPQSIPPLSMVVREAWHMTRDGLKGQPDPVRHRIADQVRFLAELQKGFYEQHKQVVRGFGFKGLVVASNWQTADHAVLDPVERWTYTAGDIIDQHGYFGGKHEGDGASYSVRVGHTFTDRAATKHPAALPIRFRQVLGYPQMISELGWTNPNKYRADWVPLSSIFGAVQGVDAMVFFSMGSNYVADNGMNKFGLASPVGAGGFPACALIYRRADLPQQRLAVVQKLTSKRMFSLNADAIAGEQNLDLLRKANVPSAQLQGPPPGDVRQLAYYTGPVAYAFDHGVSKVDHAVARVLAATDGTLTAAGAAVVWDYDAGVVTLNTPRAVGAIGMLKRAGSIDVGGFTIDCKNEHASVLIVSLDDKPLAQSRRMLLQSVTHERPCGFKAEGGRIIDLGGPPLNVESVRLRVFFPYGAGLSITALDENGYRRSGQLISGERRPEAPGRIVLPDDAIYHLIER